ncbi:hypothetical protein [Chlorogloeopsis fritschii]|uniref:hypothetical protein n=1 Tax=Chlorogloeopsis fritschii TaxID=1124 RepID=UPI0023F3C8F6|nr:hypothetical protein [Chlorogloeopsis fritschii]
MYSLPRFIDSLGKSDRLFIPKTGELHESEPRLNPGRLPFSYNIFVDKLDNPYQD